jgi:hypothetical protein
VPGLEAPGQVDVADVDHQLLARLQVPLAELLQVFGQRLDHLRVGATLITLAVEAGIAEVFRVLESHLDLGGRGALCHAVKCQHHQYGTGQGGTHDAPPGADGLPNHFTPVPRP